MRGSFYILILFLLLQSCTKEFVQTDPLTGEEVQSLTTRDSATCLIAKIRQISGKTSFNRLEYQRDNGNKIMGLNYYDSITNTVDYKVSFQYRGDTIVMGNAEWMVQDPKTKNINQYFLRDTTNDLLVDDILYEYKYDLNGKLVQKLIFYNNSTEPDYITNYLYDGNNLITTQLFAGDGITKLMQTDLTYDLNTTIKPWLYLYGDAFESYRFVQGFSFGSRSTLAVKKIVSTIYDANYGNVLDTWTTNFSGYVISKDQYVLQVTCDGDLQQGMGLLLGTIRFDYQCN